MKLPRSQVLASRPTPLGAIDARVKLLLTLLYTLSVVAVPFDDPVLLLPLAVPLSLAVGAGDVPLGYLARRLLLGLPFVIVVILFPLLSDQGWVAYDLAGVEIALPLGVVRASAVCGKYVLAFGAVIVLTTTTELASVCAAMTRLRCPAIFVGTVAMVWRYLSVLVDEVGRMRQARQARTARKMSLRLSWTSSAAIVGGLFVRALRRSERVHAAMTARGFAGTLPEPALSRMRPADWTVLGAGAVYAITILMLAMR